MRAAARFAWAVLAALLVSVWLEASGSSARRQIPSTETTLRHEGEAILALADDAAAGRAVPAGLSAEWHNDFLKAQSGTFVPFVVRISAPRSVARAVLLYVRVTPRAVEAADAGTYPFEGTYPVELPPDPARPARVMRGFSVPAGEYDLTIVVRERQREGARQPAPLAAVLRRTLAVPDFATGELATSTIMLADSLAVVPDPASVTLGERPYVIGGQELQPADDSIFRPNEELIAVFLVYNPSITRQKHFDLEVEYHFFKRLEDGEVYVNRTEPQRFNPAVLGPQYDPSAGQPVMAGQAVPLAGFAPGDYRLGISVKDLVSTRSVEHQLFFTVRP